MARSFSLWIYLRFARRASASGLDGPVLDGPVLDRPVATPKGREGVPPVDDTTPRIWLHATRATPLRSLAHLARQMTQARPGLQFMVTGQASTPDLSGFPPGTLSAPLPDDRLPDLQAFLDRFQPTMAVLTGLDLPPALICAIAGRAIPLVLADVHLTPKERTPWRWPRRMASSLLDRFDLILARDLDSIRTMQTLFSSGLNIEVTGRLEETTDALPHSESERNEMAELLRTRPVWLAAACPPTEEAAVVAAHSRAMRYAHRILLILAPSEPARGGALAEALQVAGLNVARRSLDQEPEDDVQVFIADTDDEMGLWYRLAPVTYMGGTLVEGGAGRNPMEPAALGSAIVHGPNPGPYPEAYARLTDAFAARRVASGPDLADAITDLIAPDKAAFLAHNAWAAASGGAEVTERVMRLLFGLLGSGSDAPAPKAKASRKATAAGKGAS